MIRNKGVYNYTKNYKEKYPTVLKMFIQDFFWMFLCIVTYSRIWSCV